jgi:hypothetical protein
MTLVLGGAWQWRLIGTAPAAVPDLRPGDESVIAVLALRSESADPRL